jgi:hypothetical protein
MSLREILFRAVFFYCLLITVTSFAQTEILQDDIIGQQVTSILSTSCDNTINNSNPDFVNKYRRVDFYLPYIYLPKIIKIDLHVFCGPPGSGTLQGSTNDISNLTQIINWINYWYDNVNLPTDPIVPPAPFVGSTGIHFELEHIYFYSGTSYWNQNSITGLPAYVNSIHPGCTNENLPIYLVGSGPPPFSSSTFPSYIGNPSPASLSGDSYARIGNQENPGGCYACAQSLAHELGHCMDLMHAYEASCCHEVCDASSTDYLWDVFGLTPPANCWTQGGWGCNPVGPGGCTNNMMDGTGGPNAVDYYFSPLQIAKMHRACYIKSVRKYVKDCPVSTLPFIVAQSELWNFDIRMYQNIEVNSGTTLTIQCRVHMPPGTQIIVHSGGTLILDGAVIDGSCHLDLWDGIVIESGGGLTMMNGSTVRDATIAVDNDGGTTGITLTNSNLIANKTAIRLAYADYTNTFSMTGMLIDGGMLNDGTHANTGIRLDDALNVTIGDAAQNSNTIQALYFGILDYTSSAVTTGDVTTIRHTDLNNIPSSQTVTAHGIVATGNNAVIRQLIVGGANANEACHFTNCTNAVRTTFNFANTITRNTFTIDASYTGTASTQGVYAINNKLAAQNISFNHFTNIKSGIYILRTNSSVTVDGNDFNLATGSTVCDDAIQVRNTSADGQSPITSISRNHINKYRHGILTTWLKKQVDIDLNNINPDVNVPVTSTYGIKTQSCLSNNIKSNDFFWMASANPSQALENIMMGISVESGGNNFVSGNYMYRSATGIRFFNCNALNTVSCNHLSNSSAGVSLINSNIGNQGSAAAASDNYWTGNGTQHANIFNPTLNIPTWYVRTGTAGYDPGTCANCIVPAGSVTASFGSPNSNCGPPCTSPGCLQMEIYQMIKEEGNYSGLDEDAKYSSKVYAYRQLIDNPDLMHLSNDKDADLQDFFNSMQASNIGALNNVAELIQKNDNVQAQLVNTTITPENMSEVNARSVNDIYLRTWSVDVTEFTEGDRDILLNIAYQNPITGGGAVYDARTMLMIDADDYYFDGMRKANQNEKSVSEFGKIIPNPSSGTMQFVYKLNDNESGILQIFDLKGHQLKLYTLQAGENIQDIVMNDADCGIYLYRLTVNDKIVLTNKIVIQK